MNELAIEHKKELAKGIFFIPGATDEELLGELTYEMASPTVMAVLHTGVRDQLKGTGAARKLVNECVSYARESGFKIMPFCPYVHRVFEKTPELADLRVDPAPLTE